MMGIEIQLFADREQNNTKDYFLANRIKTMNRMHRHNGNAEPAGTACSVIRLIKFVNFWCCLGQESPNMAQSIDIWHSSSLHTAKVNDQYNVSAT